MKLGTIFKLIVIALGVFSVIMLAWRGFGLEPIFSEFLVRVEQVMSIAFDPIEEFIVGPVLFWLRSFGLSFELHSHWKHVFVVQWLFLGNYTRAYISDDAAKSTFSWVLAGIISLIMSVLGGLAPISDIVIAFWAMAGIMLHGLSNALWDLRARKGQSAAVVATMLGLSAFFLLVAVGAIALAIEVVPWKIEAMNEFKAVPSPGLFLTLLIVVVSAAASLILDSLIFRDGRRWLDREATRFGLDIFFVVGGAAIFVGLGFLLRSSA